MHANKDIRVDAEVSPVDIPVAGVVASLYFPVEFVGDLRNNGVLSHRDIDDYFFKIFELVDSFDFGLPDLDLFVFG